MRELQEGNEKKLDEMRRTVDEKLQTTLEKRLGESFKIVNDQLESVQKGLGEMQSLANGVGDLKRVLTNVKARGTWAEVQLGALLGEILAPGQFEKNVHVDPGAREVVESAVKLPGPRDEPGACVWLPIDSKLPQEDYIRIQDAADLGDAEATQRAVEVWRVLGADKTEFGKYGDVLDKVRRQLDTASRTIDETGVRRRAMEKKLRAVEQLPQAESELVLELTDGDSDGAPGADAGGDADM